MGAEQAVSFPNKLIIFVSGKESALVQTPIPLTQGEKLEKRRKGLFKARQRILPFVCAYKITTFFPNKCHSQHFFNQKKHGSACETVLNCGSIL